MKDSISIEPLEMVAINRPIDVYVWDQGDARTASGESLQFLSESAGSDASIPVSVKVGVERRGPDETPQWLRLESTFTDAEGRLWTNVDVVPAYTLWDDAIRTPLFAHASDIYSRSTSAAAPPDRRVEVQTLVRDILMEADTRDVRPVFVHRENSGWTDDRDRYQTLVFPIHEKYFHARLDLVEATQFIEGVKPLRISSVYLLIRPQASPTTQTAIDWNKKPVLVETVELADLGPLSAKIWLNKYLWKHRWVVVERPEELQTWEQRSPLAPIFRRVDGSSEPNPLVKVIRNA